jgi:hypothetical protein
MYLSLQEAEAEVTARHPRLHLRRTDRLRAATPGAAAALFGGIRVLHRITDPRLQVARGGAPLHCARSAGTPAVQCSCTARDVNLYIYIYIYSC